MLLEGKNAIVYGGGGTVGGAIAAQFAREGARVFLAGRTRATLDATAERIRAAGGIAETDVVDALDEAAVEAHADAVVARAGTLDISLNTISDADVQGVSLLDLPPEQFMQPVVQMIRSKLLTSRAAARHMVAQGSGVILAVGGGFDFNGGLRDYPFGGLATGFDGIETLRRQLAAELGPKGVRVVTLRTGGFPEAIPEEYASRERIEQLIDGQTLSGRAATLEDVGHVAAFAASDRARTLVGTALNMTCGAFVD